MAVYHARNPSRHLRTTSSHKEDALGVVVAASSCFHPLVFIPVEGKGISVFFFSPFPPNASTVPVRVELRDSCDFSRLRIQRPLTPTRRRREFRRIANCDVGDVRSRKNLVELTQVGSTGWGTCNTGGDKVEEFRGGEGGAGREVIGTALLSILREKVGPLVVISARDL